MVTIQDIIVAIEEFAPRDWQEPWDNAGVQVGCDLERECTGVLLTLDVSEVAVSEAVRAGANLIVSHHPLIFAELKAITGNRAKKQPRTPPLMPCRTRAAQSRYQWQKDDLIPIYIENEYGYDPLGTFLAILSTLVSIIFAINTLLFIMSVLNTSANGKQVCVCARLSLPL